MISKKAINKKMMTRMFLIGPVVGAMLGVGILIGCAGDPVVTAGPNSGGVAVSQNIEREGGESRGEHGGRAEIPEGNGGEGGGLATASIGEDGSGANLAPNETFDVTRGGARLVLNYDDQTNSFKGTVENTTSNILDRVRIEIHLSNGTELGPTTPINMAPGEVAMVNLPSTQASFTGWIAHAEVGGGGGESMAGGEHGGSGAEAGGESGRESGSEGGEATGREGIGTGGESGPDGPEGPESGGEINEAAMSSPIIPLDQKWNGVLGGLAISAQYDAVTQTVSSKVQNTTSQPLCYVQAEPHLKNGAQTVGELGPQKMGHLNPGQGAMSSLSVAGEPGLAGVGYDGYVVHMEVFDCAGPGPVAHTGGEGAEGSGGEGAGGEGHGPGGEGSGSESAREGAEGSIANTLAPDETFDMTRGGARLVMAYDAPTNSFRGIVENTTSNTLDRVRIEVHLSNGAELGPTTPINMAPGEMMGFIMPSTPESFTGWVAHAEVGGGEGSESGGESLAGGEHGGNQGSGGGEHGSGGREGGGEHGSRGERRGGG